MERVIESIKHIAFGRRVFISHAREDAKIAERIALAVRGRHCKVFLDEHDLPPGGNYEARIHQAIKSSSVFVFLISPASVTEGRYPLTELKFAREKWSHPADHVLPVPVVETPFERVPEYLRAASIMKTHGDVPAEVAAAVDAMLPKTRKRVGAIAAGLAIVIVGLSAFYLGPRFWSTKSDDTHQSELIAPGNSDTPTPSRSAPPSRSAVSFPAALDLKFSLDPQNPNDPNLSKDQVYFSVMVPPNDNERRKLALQDDGFYRQEKVETPRDNAVFYASVARSPTTSVRTNGPPAYTLICLRRADAPPDMAVRSQAVLRCKEGDQPCTNFDQTDPGWLAKADCSRKADPRSRSGVRHPARFASVFTTEALAAPVGAVWTVPSLETLDDQKAQGRLDDGFTRFSIEAAADTKIDADAFSLDLRVNDTPVLIEGLPADLRRRLLKPDRPLQVTFALQNLDFDGRYAGCDRIEARLLLYRDGEPVGTPIVLPLHYAALRDVAQTEVATDQGKFAWSAAYELARPRDARGRTQNDWRVFLTSGGRNELARLEKAREDIARLGLVLNDGGQDYPVVAVVRPPLSSNSFGLALGIVQPTGQIKFTFGPDEAARLKSFAQAARLKSPAARRLIAENPDVFIERAGADRHYACAAL